MIELSAVSKIFNSGKPNRFQALQQVSLALAERQVTVFKGPSGSGKTTLLSIVGCMLRPTSGRIRVQGQDVTSLPERFLARIRRERFGFVFQHFNLISGVTALENVMLPAYPTGRSPQRMRKRALALLEAFGLLERAHATVEHLSGGERQRTAIVRALINDPAFIIADEPTAHLDTRLTQHFLEIVATLKAGGKTVLMGSHDPTLVGAPAVDRVVELRYGRVVATEGAPC